jgi:hypothetical protein
VRVQPRDGTGARGQVGAQAAQEDHVLDAAFADRRHDRLAQLVLIGAEIGRAEVGGDQRVDGVGALERLGQVPGVGGVAGHDFRAFGFQVGELVGRARQHAQLLARRQ